MARLDGKHALVTGGAVGIGRAIAEAFLAEGADVLVTDIDAAGLETLSAELGAGERMMTLRANVADAADWDRVASLAEERFGGLDILVNNAGIELIGTVETVSEAAWDRVMAINVKGPYLGVRALLPLLRRRQGTIVNIASVAGLIGAPGWVAYISSKHALVGMTKCLALDYAKEGIRVNAVCPGMVETPMAERIVEVIGQGDAEAGQRAMEAMVPMGLFIQSEEVAAVVVHLASDEARFTTGTTYVIDGGSTATAR